MEAFTITAHYKLTADSATDYDVYVKSGDTFKMVDEVTATKYREGFKTILHCSATRIWKKEVFHYMVIRFLDLQYIVAG